MADDAKLKQLREQIDQLDDQLVDLLCERANIAREVGIAKGSKPVYQAAREAEVLQRVQDKAGNTLPSGAAKAIYREIIAACRAVQQPLKVAYLGPEGTYCEQAARTRFGAGTEFVACDDLESSVSAAQKGLTNLAVVPIENSSEGSVTRTLDLLMYSSLGVCGEIILPIRHQLMTNAKSLEDITEVMAHPQALAQCREWLAKNLSHAQRTPVNSNAAAAVIAKERPDVAAIGGEHCASSYGLPILAKDIQDENTNTTRFWVLGKATSAPTGHDKTSLICSIPNQPGSLHRLLAVLASHDVNITKLESRPSPSGLWDYVFFIDVDGHAKDDTIHVALQALHSQAIFIKVLGSYPKAEAL